MARVTLTSEDDAILDAIAADDSHERARAYRANAVRLLKTLSRPQRDLIKDPARKKCALCGRRAGKTTCFHCYVVDEGTRNADANILCTVFTLKRAKTLYWKPIQRLNTAYDLGISFHNTDLVGTFHLGGTMTIGGMESHADIDRYRGDPRALTLIIADEFASVPADLQRYFLEEVVEPAMTDGDATLVIGGTPGWLFDGPFYDCTAGVSETVNTVVGYGPAFEIREVDDSIAVEDGD